MHIATHLIEYTYRKEGFTIYNNAVMLYLALSDVKPVAPFTNMV